MYRFTLLLAMAVLAKAQTVEPKGDQPRHYFFNDAAHDSPFRVFVPSRYDGKPLPMIVALHGAGGSENTLMDWNHGQIKDLAERYGYIVVTPLGYPTGSSYGQHYDIGIPDSARAGSGMSAEERKRADEWSEKDVINVTDLVATQYRASRVYLIGHSRGALATWYLGEEYRDKWAGLAMMAGGFLNTGYPYERLRGIPVMVAQGGADTAALPERARNQVAAMKKIGLAPEYYEVPEATHGSIVELALPKVFAFFEAQRK